jgi:[glutamine synthetase] adenylyltransferase / [glutamine synthetase]-adenylyl-L-tyrosine phosphorylase
VRALRQAGFADPSAAAANFEALTPTPHDAELLAPALSRLLAELAAAPDPDMALNNLERYAAAVDRAVLFRTLGVHPGTAPLLARVGGASQFLADVLRRRPSMLAWLLEPRTMRPWLAEELAEDVAHAVRPFATREARMNALRRFKYRQLLRIGARDLLGDADLAVTTEELSRLADACLAQASADALADARARFGAPFDADGRETGLAIVGMGKLGGDELNYSSDIDLMFVYGAEGQTAGGPDGRLENGDFFARVCRDLVARVEDVTDEGYAFRVDLRLRPEGRMGSVAMALDAYAAYHRDRAELWERQALLKARICAGDAEVGARFMEWAVATVYRPGVDERVLPAIRAMKRQIDRALRGRDAEASARNVKLGRGGIREIEFIVQALQLLYGGDDPWLRERNSLKALFRLTERGYLAPDLGRRLSHALVHLRTVEHRLQIVHEFQTHTLPDAPTELGLLARRLGIDAPPRVAARRFGAEHRAVTRDVHHAFAQFFGERPAETPARPRLPSRMALAATGFADPERALQNLRMIVGGRPLVPYPAALRAALGRLIPALLDACWKSPDPDEALNQFERFLAAAGPRAGYVELLVARPELLDGLVRLCAGGDLLAQLLVAQPELLGSLADPVVLQGRRRRADFRAALAAVFVPGLGAAEQRDRLRRVKQAQELTVVWRYLLGVTDVDRYAREMTALAEATLAAGWVMALGAQVQRYGVPCDARGRFIPAVIVGLGKLGGRELTTGSDLDLFVTFGRADSETSEGETDGDERVDAHTFYSGAVERLASALGDITAAGIAFPVDLRLRPGSKGSGFAAGVDALERYYEEHGDLWERQSLTRARPLLGDRALARRVRATLARLVYGAPLPAGALKEIRDVRRRMEVELGKETRGRWHVKLGRGGLVDVEFLTQALQLVHGAAHPDVRTPSTAAALTALGDLGLLPAAPALVAHHRFLRRVSTALRLLGARPTDTLELAGPMPARVAAALGLGSRDAFLAAYREHTSAVREAYDDVMSEPASRTPVQ